MASFYLKYHRLLARYVKLRVAHAPGMPGTFPPPPWVSDPDMHHGDRMPGSLYSSSLWIRWRGKRSRHSRRMRNPQFYVSGKRPMECGYLMYYERTECYDERNLISSVVLNSISDVHRNSERYTYQKISRIRSPLATPFHSWTALNVAGLGLAKYFLIIVSFA